MASTTTSHQLPSSVFTFPHRFRGLMCASCTSTAEAGRRRRRKTSLVEVPASFAKHAPPYVKLFLVDLAAGEALLENVERRARR